MSRVGQEGDSRKFSWLKDSDYYVAKAAVDAAKREPRSFPRCKTCGQTILGSNWNGYCMRCAR